MNAFYQVVHKQTSISDTLYKFNTNDKKHDMAYQYIKTAWTNDYFQEDVKTRVIKLLIDTLVMIPLKDSVQTKFQYLKTVLDNTYLYDEQKRSFLQQFCKAQKHYRILTRMVHNYKWRKAPLQIARDIYLNPISESGYNVMTILQNNNKYLFTVTDLKNLIETAISNSPYYFSEPLPVKNPYNNMPFDKSTLYNIYFFMKTRLFVLSSTFHEYFLCNFNLKRFRDNNEVMIRKHTLKTIISTTSVGELYKSIDVMISTMGFNKKICVDTNFPKDRLLEIMKPYLNLYYKYLYSLDISERYFSKSLLKTKLGEFYNYNAQFGRKLLKNNAFGYNDDHIKFTSLDYSKNYKMSHLEIIDDSGIHLSDESDISENESEDE